MGKGAQPAVIDAKYKIVKKPKVHSADKRTERLDEPSSRRLHSWPRLTIVIAAVNASLFVRLLMKHFLNWG